MNGEYVLDSNIVIDIFRGDKNTIDQISKLSKIYIPVIVIGELYYGANKSNKPEERIQEVKELAQNVTVLFVNETTAEIYGIIKDELRQLGKPIPENDIWIAALTKEINLPIITRDKHFTNVNGIKIKRLNQK